MSMKRIIFMFTAIMILALPLSACKREELISGLREADVKVYTTIYPIQFVVEQVGGKTVSVESVYPPGVDAHTFEPTTKDMTKIATNDLFIYIGPSMEGFVESAAKTLENEAVKLVALEDYPELFAKDESHGANEEEHHEEEHHEDVHGHKHHGGIDPHIWIDPSRMVTVTQIITDLLIELNPKDEELYKKNRNELVARFVKLDHLYKNTLEKKEHKYLIVPHAAYGYWEERYGIKQIAVSGMSPSEEPSQKYLSELIEAAKEHNIDSVFYEQNTPDKLIDIVREEINAEVYTIHNLAVLTEADMKNEEDYFTLMEYNLNVMNEAFY